MKELIKRNEYGIFVDSKENVRVSSLAVAEVFNKYHHHVLRDIENILKNNGLSEEFRKTNFGLSYYITSQNKKSKCYELTRDGFMILVMGYTGKKAMSFKEWYIKRFNEMEEQLYNFNMCKLECSDLTNALQRLQSDNKFIYSNEFDMINKIVLGVSTSEFKKLHGISKDVASIRPWLTDEQIKAIRKLQQYDSVLVDVVQQYQARKAMVETYYKEVYLKDVK